MPLLTKTESSTIHAFLDTMDYADLRVSREWAMYAQHPEAEPFHDKSALTKATKDLMALDAHAPRYAPQPYYPPPPPQQQQQQQYAPQYEYQGQYAHPPAPGPAYARQPTFPFLHQQRPPPPPPHPLSMSELHHVPRPYTATPSTASASASTSSSSHSFPPDLPPSPAPVQRRASAPAVPAPAPRRPRTAPPPAKPALLSASQKKANHIQSEQKRRANIRRGYEALCAAVPALRDAIRAEEALTQPTQSPEKGKRRRGDAAEKEREREKVDGRAGPRSENVVLSKSIDYMHELLSERAALGARLERARGALPPGHPALAPPGHAEAEPLWEREWKGGVHAEEDADDDDDDSQ
ncbi:hypothetical protein B0H15DRAFT_955233 [Mycena belliarum]|uniref:BHLH domain-containing protein n=1 Tax=Mycena belliarum TaxID=1033014 RepID=A0AAD6XNM5_9AGAR|nr:hypothetical protein B0H15DRAFT_955233 [Mycena belliae]